MEEAQRQRTAAILEVAQQHGPSPPHDFAEGDPTLDDRFVAGPQPGDGHDPGTVLITQRQMEQGIGQGMDAESRQPLGMARTDPFQVGGRIHHRDALFQKNTFSIMLIE